MPNVQSLIRSLAGWLLCGALTFTPAIACAQSRTARDSAAVSEVIAAFNQYADRLRAMDHAGIAKLFLPSGAVVNPGQAPIVGPAAIERFLQSFSGYSVLRYDATVDSVAIVADTAFQTGHFTQRVRTPAGDTLTVSGSLRARWVRDKSGAWRVLEMGTAP